MNISPLSSNHLLNKTLKAAPSAQEQSLNPNGVLSGSFGQLLAQALLQAQMSVDDQGSTSSFLGGMNPINLTSLGLDPSLVEALSSKLGGENIVATSTETIDSSFRTGSSVLAQYQDKGDTNLEVHLDGALKNAGNLFVEAGKKYQINPVFLAAISMHETGNGSSNAVRFKNNVAGMMGKNGLKSYGSIEESIFDMARNLRENYLDEGKLSVAQIGAKYAPVGAANDPTGLNNHWVKGVQHYLDKITKTDFIN